MILNWSGNSMHLCLVPDLREKSFNLSALNMISRVPVVAQWKQIQLGTMRLSVRSLALLNGLRIWRCHELWCGSQMRLRSGIAVAVA